ncbi:uncharacterized protein LOC132713964 [Ruditapes philippinarum]|uniref:uncharacterized protein LOC132713964 n=1 Tax=Ruditapes philippinarum TaxID=129788 RepID=UPI00295B9C64|nr:uncharacterized protein LOC132713964 [Ruditapes philippinarum]XP_060552686.1 uncharacterized protein LOC132713964 [Ruditapes philippinarum]
MATSKKSEKRELALDIFCDPCKTGDEHKLSSAVSYCRYCNEYLCQNCHNVHKQLKATKTHLVKLQDEMPLERMSNTTDTDPPEKCLAHGDQVIDNYCVTHEELCCPQCLATNHKTCEDVRNIKDYLYTFDFQREANEIECKMRQLADEVDKIMDRVNSSLKAVDIYHSKAQSEMLEVKHSAIDHIECKYKELAKEVNRMRVEDLERIMQYKNKCDAIAFDMRTIGTYLSGKKKSSGNQLFIAMKNIDVKIRSNLRDLTKVKCIEHYNITRYHFKPAGELDNMKSQQSSFGSIQSDSNVIKSARKARSLHVKDDDDEENCCITGIALLAKTRIVLADNNNLKLKLFHIEEDKLVSKIEYESAPWDVTCVSNRRIAVTFPDLEIVELLSIDGTSELTREQDNCRITCSGKCYGITSSNDTVIVIVKTDDETTKVERYKLDGSLLLSVGVDVNNPQYVVCYEDESRTYISDNASGNDIVELSSDNFTTLGKLSSCRDEVTGMAIDKTGLLYYCDSFYHEIDLVNLNKEQANGRKRHELISDKEPNPKCLAFCNDTKQLFVGLDGNEIKIYSVF